MFSFLMDYLWTFLDTKVENFNGIVKILTRKQQWLLLINRTLISNPTPI